MQHPHARSLILLAASLGPAATALGQIQKTQQPARPSLVWETSVSLTSALEGADEMAVDASGAVLVMGYLNVERDFYVLKFSSSGSLLWTRVFGGNAQDYASGMALDAAGDLYVCGNTTSDDFPTLLAYQPLKNGPSDAFLVKLSGADGSTVFSTLFGGSRHEWAHDVAIGPQGDIYLAGSTDSLDLETVNPIQPNLTLTQCFCDDAFVTRFTPLADAVSFSTYLGGAFDDAAHEIEVDAAGNIAIAGVTRSADFPTSNAFQPALGGGESDAFVARIEANETLGFSTFLGGEDRDSVQGMDLDPQGAIYVTGSTQSITFPTTPGAFEQSFVGGINSCEVPFSADRNCFDFFVTKLATDGSLSYSTFVGGQRDDEPRNLVLDHSGQAYVTGYTYSSDFPDEAPFGTVVVLRLSADGSQLHYALTHDTPGPNGGSAVALRGRSLYIASSIGLPYDTYVAKYRLPKVIQPQ